MCEVNYISADEVPASDGCAADSIAASALIHQHAVNQITQGCRSGYIRADEVVLHNISGGPATRDPHAVQSVPGDHIGRWGQILGL